MSSMESITLEELAPYLPPEIPLTKKAVFKYLEKDGEREDVFRRLVKKRFRGTVSERIKQGRYIFEIRPIYRPIITKETLLFYKQKGEKLYGKLIAACGVFTTAGYRPY